MPSGYGHWTGENSGRPGGPVVPLLITGAIMVGFVKLASSRVVERVAGDVSDVIIGLVIGGVVVGVGALGALFWFARHRNPVPPWQREAVRPVERPAVAGVRSPAVGAVRPAAAIVARPSRAVEPADRVLSGRVLPRGDVRQDGGHETP